MKRRKLIACLLVLGFGSRGSAQMAGREIPYRASCARCTISVTRVMRVGGARDSVLAGSTGQLAVDSRGRYFAVAHDRLAVLVYNPAGALIAAMGRRGQGPGEYDGFGIEQIAVDRWDSLLVHNQGRVSVYSPELRFVRSFRLPPSTVTGFRVLRDGRLVIGAIMRTPENIGYAYHVVSRDGAVIRSFADAKLSELGISFITPPVRNLPSRLFAVAPDDKSIWIAASHHLRQIALDGKIVRAFDVKDAPWYPVPRETTYAGRGGTSYRAYVGTGDSDVAGVFAGVLWVSAVRPSGAPGGHDTYGLDAFDPETGRLIAGTKPPTWVSFLADGRAWSSEEDADGVISFVIWKVSLVGR